MHILCININTVTITERNVDVKVPTSLDSIEPKKRGRPPKSAQEKDADKAQRELDELTAWRNAMRKKWGSRFDADGNSRDYTDAEYRELESYYEIQSAEYNHAITARQEGGVIEVCELRLELKRCIAANDSAGAKRYSDMINSVMSREAMKAGDVKSLEATRIDMLIMNLESKGAIKNHKIVGRDELIDIIAKDHPKYHTSRDVVDAIIMAIINTMRKNNGESELDALPLSAQVDDVFDELLSQPSQPERKAMAEIGVVPPMRE